MSAEPMKWFRMYADCVDDEKLRLLAFEDRWHFVAILALKCAGLLDAGDAPAMLERKLCLKLGLGMRELSEVKRRLNEVSLVDEHWQPIGWTKRQYLHDRSTERTRQWRDRKKAEKAKPVTACDGHRDVTVTGPDPESETEKSAQQAPVDKSERIARLKTIANGLRMPAVEGSR